MTEDQNDDSGVRLYDLATRTPAAGRETVTAASDSPAISADRLTEDPDTRRRAENWVSLREAASAARVSVSALRKAYRQGRLDAVLVAGAHGPARHVELGQVLRTVGPATRAARPPAATAGSGQATPADLVVPRQEWTALLRELAGVRQLAEDLADARHRAMYAEGRLRDLEQEAQELRAELEAAGRGKGSRWRGSS